VVLRNPQNKKPQTTRPPPPQPTSHPAHTPTTRHQWRQVGKNQEGTYGPVRVKGVGPPNYGGRGRKPERRYEERPAGNIKVTGHRGRQKGGRIKRQEIGYALREGKKTTHERRQGLGEGFTQPGRKTKYLLQEQKKKKEKKQTPKKKIKKGPEKRHKKKFGATKHKTTGCIRCAWNSLGSSTPQEFGRRWIVLDWKEHAPARESEKSKGNTWGNGQAAFPD